MVADCRSERGREEGGEPWPESSGQGGGEGALVQLPGDGSAAEEVAHKEGRHKSE